MIKKINKHEVRLRKQLRVRKKIAGTNERPRLNVFRSNKNMYAQIIDDAKGVTLVSASTLDKDLRDQIEKGGGKAAAKMVGEAIAKKALAAGIEDVVFDRGGYIYTGRVKELADGAREAGLKF